VERGARAALPHTDWRIVTNFFERHKDRYQATFHYHSKNPEVKDRAAAVNAKLLKYAGERHLKIDPGCKELIEDLEQVSWQSDPHGNLKFEIDKSNPKRTHLSDTLGYLIEYQFPLRFKSGERSGSIL